MLKLVNISKSYKKYEAIKNVNATFFDHSLTLIYGKSGNGKTTLLNLLSSLDTPTSGKIYYNEQEINKSFGDIYRNSCVSLVSQQLNLINELTIKENLEIACHLAKKEPTDDYIISILEQVNLTNDEENIQNLLRKKPNEISQGQAQRIAIGRSLIKDTGIIILDEPTSALDDENSTKILELLKTLSKTKTIIISSHDTTLVKNYADQIFEMRNGTLITEKEFVNNKEIKNIELSKSKKGFLTFFDSFKLALKNLKHKKIKLLTSFLIAIISITSFGFYEILNTTPQSKIALKAQFDNRNSNHYTIVSNYSKYEEYISSGLFWAYHQVEYTNEQLEIIKEITNDRYLNYYQFTLTRNPFNSSTGYKHSSLADMYLSIQNQYFMSLTNNIYQWLGMEKYSKLLDSTECKIPENDDEIAIGGLRAETYLEYGFYDEPINETDIYKTHVYKPSSLDDIIGKKLLGKYKITGIFSVEDQVGEALSNYVKPSGKIDEILDNKLIKNFYNSISLSSFLFFSDSYVENILKKSYDVEKSKSLIIGIDNDFNTTLSKLNKLNMDDLHTEINNEYSLFVSQAQIQRGQVDLLLKIILILSLIITFLICLNLFYSNIKAMNKTIGILKSIGCSKFSLVTIILLQSVTITLSISILSICSLALLCQILNSVNLLTLYIINGITIGYIFLIFSINAFAITIFAGRKAILSKPIISLQSDLN